jgi:hypothetical protein
MPPAGPGRPTPGEDADVSAFRLGQQSAFEPPPDVVGADAAVITTQVSWWNHLICDTCGHTFRRGDRVRHEPGSAQVAHLDPGLGCAAPSAGNQGAAGPASGSDLAQFAGGLGRTWPPTGNVRVTRLDKGDWRTGRPRPPFERARCLYCAHTFREGEHVIVCPCRPGDPACGAAVHRDPAAGLICWETWQPEGRVRQCPVSATDPVTEHP